jgi:hypothetical protein
LPWYCARSAGAPDRVSALKSNTVVMGFLR